jgi:hypothetical protein
LKRDNVGCGSRFNACRHLRIGVRMVNKPNLIVTKQHFRLSV